MNPSIIHVLDPAVGDRVIQVPVPLTPQAPGAPQILLLGIGTLLATRDPGLTDDINSSITVGMVWFNSAAGFKRWWVCYDNAVGAAKWVYEGADFTNGGTAPAIQSTQFGLGTGVVGDEGNINRQISAAGVQPGATGADNVVAVYTLPASSFDALGRGLEIVANGSFGATANNKRIKIIFNPATAVLGSTVGGGGTTIADTGTVATNGGGWSLEGAVYKYGAAGSNTQLGVNNKNLVGAAASALLAPALATAAENGAILIAVTGNATTAVSDIVSNLLKVRAMN